MGWTFFNHQGRDTVELLKRDNNSENDYGIWQWLDHSKVGNVVYALIKFTPKTMGPHQAYGYVRDIDGSYKQIVVFLTSRKNGEFGYKDISESMGPCETKCPVRLIKAASELYKTGHYAADWRKRCLERASRPKIVPGVRFKTLNPVSFDNGALKLTQWECTTYRRRTKNMTCYRSLETGQLYRFNPDNYGVELLNAD